MSTIVCLEFASINDAEEIATVYVDSFASHRRMGAASAHITWGIQISKQYCLPCLVDASEKSAPLLRSHGFKEYARLETDLKRWGGDGISVHTCMIWDPEIATG